jgi:spore coat protein H
MFFTPKAARTPAVETRRFVSGVFAVVATALCCAGAAGAQVASPPGLPQSAPATSAELFSASNIWNIHLTLTAEQFAAMEPEGGGFGGPFGRRGGPGGFGERGGPGPRGGPGAGGFGFGPAMFLAPMFLEGADSNGQGKVVTARQFHAVGERLLAASGAAKEGALDQAAFRTALQKTLKMPDFGPRGGPRGGMSFVGEEGKRNGLASTMGVEFKYVKAQLQFEDKTFPEVALRYKGNGTWMQSQGQLKRSMKASLDKFAKDGHLAGVTKLNLHNNVTDASYMNETLAYRLYRDAGVPAPRSTFARVYVTAGAEHQHQYFGLYSIIENVDEHFAEDRFGALDGAIFKPVVPSLFAVRGTEWKDYKQAYDPKTKLTQRQIDRLLETCRFFENAPDEEFNKHVGDYVDLEEFSRYLAVTVWVCDLDGMLGPGQNFYVYLDPKTNKFLILPWDQDHSFGQMRGSQEQREQLSIEHPWTGESRFLERMFKQPEFHSAYRARLEEFSKTIFQPTRIAAQVDEVAATLRPAVAEESETMLARFNDAVAGKSPSFGGSRGGRGFGGPGMFGDSKPIKGYIQPRAESVNAQLAGKSEGQQVGEFGFGGPRRGGGPGGPPGFGGRREGGPMEFGPAMFLTPQFFKAIGGKDGGKLTTSEFLTGFDALFAKWDGAKAGALTEAQLREGINKDLEPFRGGPPGMDFGPPEDDDDGPGF